jgi:hypothetical protein
VIPQEAIEAAAAAHANHGGYTNWEDWETEVKAEAMEDMWTALEAAAPFILADAKREALEDAADAIDLPGTDATGYYSSGDAAGYAEAERHAEAWLRARAKTVGGEE